MYFIIVDKYGNQKKFYDKKEFKRFAKEYGSEHDCDLLLCMGRFENGILKR